MPNRSWRGEASFIWRSPAESSVNALAQSVSSNETQKLILHPRSSVSKEHLAAINPFDSGRKIPGIQLQIPQLVAILHFDQQVGEYYWLYKLVKFLRNSESTLWSNQRILSFWKQKQIISINPLRKDIHFLKSLMENWF